MKVPVTRIRAALLRAHAQSFVVVELGVNTFFAARQVALTIEDCAVQGLAYARRVQVVVGGACSICRRTADTFDVVGIIGVHSREFSRIALCTVVVQ